MTLTPPHISIYLAKTLKNQVYQYRRISIECFTTPGNNYAAHRGRENVSSISMQLCFELQQQRDQLANARRLSTQPL